MMIHRRIELWRNEDRQDQKRFLKERNEKDLLMRQSQLELQKEILENADRKTYDATMKMLTHQQQ